MKHTTKTKQLVSVLLAGGLLTAQAMAATTTAPEYITITGSALPKDHFSIAIGKGAKTNGTPSPVAIGTESEADGNAALAVGSIAKATGIAASALGQGANATANAATAVGRGSQASGVSSTAIGSRAEAIGTSATAFGSASSAAGNNSTALGQGSSSAGGNSTAVGTKANASGDGSAAIGSTAAASGVNSVAAGTGASASGATSVASGNKAAASATNAIALGNGAQAIAAHAIAAGASAVASGATSIASGLSAVASGGQAIAIGRNATAADDFSVALGSYSTTAPAVGTNDATVNGVTYSGFAGNTPVATVSVGTSGQERTITNVAAGRVNATSTDAINGSQLYILANDLQNKATAANSKVAAGSNIVVTPNTSTDGSTTYTVATSPDLVVDSVTAGNTVLNNGGVTISNGAAGSPVSLTQSGLDNGGNKITNVAAGTDATDAVNVSQLNSAKTEVVAGDNVTVDKTTGANGQDIYKISANTAAWDSRINNRINDMEKDLRAGIAGATAIAFLQRPNEAGKSIVSAAVGGFRDQQALAVGYARNSDNNKWSIKAGVGLNTQKDVNWGGSVGYQW